ncbi:hypothetical protein RHGRI_038559 [Rhododendron griersonianum]|uniref:Uncharacterized protein n=1 Tax=Rhododendron griersonianum TaxID=479676 RepID=A0AAV6HMF1_9ERIC|nr:hypothetical protein RHGRI_038559 [Rhododendron griersonianum]
MSFGRLKLRSHGNTLSVPFLDIRMVHVIPYSTRDMECHSLSLSACIAGVRLGRGMNCAEALFHQFGMVLRKGSLRPFFNMYAILCTNCFEKYMISLSSLHGGTGLRVAELDVLISFAIACNYYEGPTCQHVILELPCPDEVPCLSAKSLGHPVIRSDSQGKSTFVPMMLLLEVLVMQASSFSLVLIWAESPLFCAKFAGL